ncbi:MAG: VOC family protein [Dehalococcoidia bacterium]
MTEARTPAALGLLDMLQTSTEDMRASVAFYRDALGAHIEVESPEWSQVRLGGVSIGIHGPGASYEGWLPAFRVGDLASARAALEAAGATVEAPHDIPGGVAMQVTDADGHRLALTQYGISAADLEG